MNVYVLMIACVSHAHRYYCSPPRWNARLRRCSPSCSLTPHVAARPSRVWKASGARNRPRMVLVDRVRLCLRVYLRAYLRFCLRVKNQTPGVAGGAPRIERRQQHAALQHELLRKARVCQAREEALVHVQLEWLLRGASVGTREPL
jgi:hypothetical protein